MRKLIRYFISTLALCAVACSDDSPGPYGQEQAYAIAQKASRVVTYTSTKAILEYDFVFYDENGPLDLSKFTLEERTLTFGTNGKLDIKLSDVKELAAESRGCYSAAVLTEQNAMERPERPEQLARYIFKNTPSCSNYTLAVYPDRDASLNPSDPYKILGTTFLNDDYRYDQDLAAISSKNFQLFEDQKDPYDSQLRGLDAVTKFIAANAQSGNKQVFMMYQNFTDENTDLSISIRNYAIANNIVINAVKNDYSSGDVMLNLAMSTGGLYFMPADFDPFHVVAKSDYYAIALHADKFMSGNYKFYRATYELTTNVDYFHSDMSFWFNLRAILDQKLDGDDDIIKPMPCYVQIP